MRLLCDEMLGRLARWLRAAGHDTRLATPGQDDRAVLWTAIAEDRLLLSRDRGFAERKAATGRLLLLESSAVPEQARELRRRLGLDWLAAPFTRCVVDNAHLRPASSAERARLPGGARRIGGPYFACPACGRLYWAGDHHARMRARLEDWAGS